VYCLAVYGKGGVGKSTVSANISYLLSQDGSSVLHVGCDPKHDSTRLLTHGVTIRTFSEDVEKDPVVVGINSIRCVECGGADPGKGCAGKGMEMLFSKIADVEADYRVCDVLGDVVCGGFSIPARAGNSDAILIVTSGEFMSLFAANNILRGLENINPGESVIGLVFNRRGDENEEQMVKSFSEAVGIPIVCDIPRSDLFRDAEARGEVLCSIHTDSKEAAIFRELTEMVRKDPVRYRPRALSEDAMTDLAAGRPIRKDEGVKREKCCSFDGFDSERNLTYLGEFVMPACTSHGAVDGAMKITDAAVIVHGPRNCSYLMEFAYRRRTIHNSSERSGGIPEPGVYSTGLNAEEAFRDSGVFIEKAVLDAKKDGFNHMFLISTCSSEIMGTDIRKIAGSLSRKHSVDIIPVDPDQTFLGSKFGGSFGVVEALVARMRPREVEKGTVNLIARWFYGFGKDRIQDDLDYVLSKLGLRIRFKFVDYATLDEVEDFCKAEYDIQLGHSGYNIRMSKRIAEVTGRRKALELDMPIGLEDCLDWVRKISDYAPELKPLLPAAEESFRKDFDDILKRYRPLIEGKKVIIYCIMVRDLEWQVDVLRKLGANIHAIMFADGAFIDHNLRVPDYGDVRIIEHVGMCDLRKEMSSNDIDIVITNDADRVSREGYRFSQLGSRYYGMDGVEDWIHILADSLRGFTGNWEGGL